MDYEARANHQLETVSDEKIDLLAKKAKEKLDAQRQSSGNSSYDALLKRLSEETGLSVEEIDRQIM